MAVLRQEIIAKDSQIEHLLEHVAEKNIFQDMAQKREVTIQVQADEITILKEEVTKLEGRLQALNKDF